MGQSNYGQNQRGRCHVGLPCTNQTRFINVKLVDAHGNVSSQSLDAEQEGAVRALIRCLRFLLGKWAIAPHSETRSPDQVATAFKPLYDIMRDSSARIDVRFLLESVGVKSTVFERKQRSFPEDVEGLKIESSSSKPVERKKSSAVSDFTSIPFAVLQVSNHGPLTSLGLFTCVFL